MRYKTLIFDTDDNNRRAIRRSIESCKCIQIVTECPTCDQALSAIVAGRPDIAIVAIGPADLCRDRAMELAHSNHCRAIICVAAQDEWIETAIRMSAVDCLLKPPSHDRIRLALGRAVQAVRKHVFPDKSKCSCQCHANTEQLVVKSASDLAVLKMMDVTWVESAGNYVLVHTNGAHHMIRGTLQDFHARLAPSGFVRIHRTALVNKRKIVSVSMSGSGDGVVKLEDGTSLRLSRRYRERLRARLTKP